MLILLGGLPGVGKTTLARRLAQERRAVWLRIDLIEQALRDSGMLASDVGPAGYMAAHALADANLRLGLDVVADCVNPLPVTRDAWRRVARGSGARFADIEILCSDPSEHRRRVEMRATDIPGLVLPDWKAVQARDYRPNDAATAVIDTAGRRIEESMIALRHALAHAAGGAVPDESWDRLSPTNLGKETP